MNHLEDAGGQRRFLVILMSVLSEEEEDENEMTETDEQQCMRLQENDPTLSEVTIISLNNNNARRYGEALQHNTVVNKLTVWRHFIGSEMMTMSVSVAVSCWQSREAPQ
jgi:hypothetical protein